MKITDEVYALESTRGNFAYVILGEGAMLVDTGLPGQGHRILKELGKLNVQPRDVRHIFLTHHDVDHIGNAAYLQQACGAQVWASAIDLVYILGQTPRPWLKRMASRLFDAKVPASIKTYPPENTLEGLTIIPSPGHTPGHVCLLYKDVLFTGDLVVSRRTKLLLSPPFMTWDGEMVEASARNVGKYPFHWVCTAHGRAKERGDLWERLFEEA